METVAYRQSPLRKRVRNGALRHCATLRCADGLHAVPTGNLGGIAHVNLEQNYYSSLRGCFQAVYGKWTFLLGPGVLLGVFASNRNRKDFCAPVLGVGLAGPNNFLAA
jgi:hypothetical protein